MTPDERRAAADALRAMEADDDIERDFLDRTAAALDRFADEVVDGGGSLLSAIPRAARRKDGARRFPAGCVMIRRVKPGEVNGPPDTCLPWA